MRSTDPLPIGFTVEVDPDTRTLDEGILFGGSPARIMRLTDTGRACLDALDEGPIQTRQAGVLARRLTDANAAQPQPPALVGSVDVTVVIPVKDRVELLDQCLTALGHRYPVLIVDDASDDSAAVAGVARSHGARLVVRSVNGGPAAARNTGIAAVDTAFIAFLDSDTLPVRSTSPEGDWIDRLAAHCADPMVAAVAPRVVAEPSSGGGSAHRFTRAHGTLDMGDRPGRVAPGSRLPYVPTAALLVRRAAVSELGDGGDPFDEALRVGEDVDFVWRLDRAGWRVRYQPDVQVAHQEPPDWSGLLRRRFFYGTSAAALARRHPQAMAPLALHPWPTLVVAALALQRPGLALTAFGGSVLSMRRTLLTHQIPSRGVVSAMASGAVQTWWGIGRYATQFASPALALAWAGSRRRTRRSLLTRRLAVLSLILGPPIRDWLPRRGDIGIIPFVLGRLADDLAYGAGVWTGAAAARSGLALRPKIINQQTSIARSPSDG